MSTSEARRWGGNRRRRRRCVLGYAHDRRGRFIGYPRGDKTGKVVGLASRPEIGFEIAADQCSPPAGVTRSAGASIACGISAIIRVGLRAIPNLCGSSIELLGTNFPTLHSRYTFLSRTDRGPPAHDRDLKRRDCCGNNIKSRRSFWADLPEDTKEQN
jgi:hypothetical protein